MIPPLSSVSVPLHSCCVVHFSLPAPMPLCPLPFSSHLVFICFTQFFICFTQFFMCSHIVFYVFTHNFYMFLWVRVTLTANSKCFIHSFLYVLVQWLVHLLLSLFSLCCTGVSAWLLLFLFFACFLFFSLPLSRCCRSQGFRVFLFQWPL